MRFGIVTGGNRGIGYEVVRGLLRESNLDKIVIATRSKKNGLEAIEKLRNGFENIRFILILKFSLKIGQISDCYRETSVLLFEIPVVPNVFSEAIG